MHLKSIMYSIDNKIKKHSNINIAFYVIPEILQRTLHELKNA